MGESILSPRRPNREYLESVRCGVFRLDAGRCGQCRESRGRDPQSVADVRRDVRHLHGRVLLPEADALPGVSSLRRDLFALLLQADALPELSSLRRDLRALLLQADALFLHAHRPARVLRDAAVRRPLNGRTASE